MATKQLKNGVTKVVEFLVSERDEIGDALDTNTFDTRAEAEEYAMRAWKLKPANIVEIEIERMTSFHPFGEGETQYETVMTIG